MTYRLQGIFTAIADPHRRRMLDYLAASDLTAGQVAARFEISRTAVVSHLRVLEKNNLVVVTRRGRERIHRLNPGPLLTVRDWLATYDRFWEDRLDRLKTIVEAGPGDYGSKDRRG